MFSCTFCGARLEMLPDGNTAVACNCVGALQDRTLQRERTNQWNADREKAINDRRRENDRKRIKPCGST